jgi:stage III sporulation protein AA
MGFSWLPERVNKAILHVNEKYLSEIRLKKGQPVIIEYRGTYVYLGDCGITERKETAIWLDDVEGVLSAAMRGNVFNYAEQLKNAFITVEHGVRIGVAGEYVTERGVVQTVRCVTSLNIRIPHEVIGCSQRLFQTIFKDQPCNTLLFSRAGLGKTTMLRDIANGFSAQRKYNILVFDERNEIAAFDENGVGFYLGERVDVVRGSQKLCAMTNAVRAMKPQIMICDELYGDDDCKAVADMMARGIKVVACTHVEDREVLKKMPFEVYVQLTAIGGEPILYDKNFNLIGDSGGNDNDRCMPRQ